MNARGLFAVFLLYSAQRLLGVQTWVTQRLGKPGRGEWVNRGRGRR